MKPKGTILFSIVGRLQYGFDIFSVTLPLDLSEDTPLTALAERRLTDGTSVNFNGQFVDENGTLTYISERSGAPRIYLNRPGTWRPDTLPFVEESLFHDRPIVKDDQVYFVSAHEAPDQPFKSSCAIYASSLAKPAVVRLTPRGAVDYSPALSRSGKLIAVASYGSCPWRGEFEDLRTDIVVFPVSDPDKRTVIAHGGGWPSWCGDSSVIFHRKVEDGWWSVFRVDLPENFQDSGVELPKACRITPPGLHVFTPSASHDGKRIAVATRRPGSGFRHVEIYDTLSDSFYRVTQKLNPNFQHYNPFFSPESGVLGYHRFRGESEHADDELTILHLQPVPSPIHDLKLVRINGYFPSVSPDGGLIAINSEFLGLQILKKDGSRKWTVFRDRMAFQTCWSPTEPGVIYTSIGPIFESVRATVQIARVSFSLTDLDGGDEIKADVKILTREDAGNNAFPSCSPDGKHLVFRSGRSGHKNLYIVDAVDGEGKGEARRLTDGPWVDTMPSWSPDGELIAFSSNRYNDDPAAYGLYLIRPDGTDLRRVEMAGKESARERINHVCFSPDSEWLLFSANLGGVTAEPVSLPNQFQPYGELFISRVDGTELRRLTWNAYEDGTPWWCSGEGEACAVDIGKLSFAGPAGEKLEGQFEEPRWITFVE